MTPDCVVFTLFRAVPLTWKKHLLACVNFCEQRPGFYLLVTHTVMKCPLMQEAGQKEQGAAGTCILLPFHTPTTRHKHTQTPTGPHRHSMMTHNANRLKFDKTDRLKTGDVSTPRGYC